MSISYRASHLWWWSLLSLHCGSANRQLCQSTLQACDRNETSRRLWHWPTRIYQGCQTMPEQVWRPLLAAEWSRHLVFVPDRGWQADDCYVNLPFINYDNVLNNSSLDVTRHDSHGFRFMTWIVSSRKCQHSLMTVSTPELPWYEEVMWMQWLIVFVTPWFWICQVVSPGLPVEPHRVTVIPRC